MGGGGPPSVKIRGQDALYVKTPNGSVSKIWVSDLIRRKYADLFARCSVRRPIYKAFRKQWELRNRSTRFPRASGHIADVRFKSHAGGRFEPNDGRYREPNTWGARRQYAGGRFKSGAIYV